MRIRTLTGLVVLLLFSLISAPVARPQTKTKSFAADKEKVTKHESQDARTQNEPPRDGEEWYARGYKLHSSDRYPEAIEAFKRAIDLGWRQSTAMYNIACGYALMNDKENALLWLQRAQESGFEVAEHIGSDSDLDPLRTDPRFKKFSESLPQSEDSLANWQKKHRIAKDRLEEAHVDYASLNQEGSPDGKEWGRVGARLLMLRELDLAIVSLNRAVTNLPDDASTAMYNLACAYSLKGDRNAGIEWLDKAVKGGFDSPAKLSYDPDINNLRSDARFVSIQKLSDTLTLSQFNDKGEHSKKDEDYMYSKERWAPAVALYSSFVKSEPNIGRAWFNLGYALHYSREHARAIEAFERASALGYHKGTSNYNIACGYAMLNQRDQAFAALDRAFKSGFSSFGSVNWDRDLDNLRSDPRFQQFVELAKLNEKSHSKKH
jgi:tetratricopeptide (TPR) repeat protein